MIVWIILTGMFTPAYILTGMLLSILAVFFTNKVLLFSDYSYKKSYNFFRMTAYFFVLLIEIYQAGFEQVYRVVTMKIDPGVIEVNTSLKSSLHTTFLANSITLKPGTLSIEQREKSILVLDIYIKDYDTKEAAERSIKGKVEKLLGGN